MNLMKKLCALLLVANFIYFGATAQENNRDRTASKFGIKLGVNLSNLYKSEVDDNNLKVGPIAGLYAKLAISEGFSIQPELLYSNKGSKLTYDNFILGTGEYRFNLNYIELPVMAVANLGRNFNIHAGPYVSYLAAVNIKDMDENGSINGVTDLKADNFKRFDYGVAAGLGVDVEGFSIGARYSYGLNEIGESGSLSGELTRNAKNSAISVYISFGF